MKPNFNPFLVLGVLSFITAHAGAADLPKANNSTALNLPGSWVSGTPGGSDIALWDNTVTGVNSTTLGAPTSWQGIRIANPGGQITIGGGDTLTLGSAGIDLSTTVTTAANLALNVPLVLSTPQAWNVTTSRTVAISTAIDAGGHVFTKSGAGSVVWQSTTTNLPAVVIQGGILRAGDGTGLPATASLSLAGGTYESTSATFVRPLGTGPGQVDLSPASPSTPENTGFSANGTALTVNLGGASAPLVWGSTPSFNPGVLVLNAATANNTITFENPIDLNGANRTINTSSSTATIPAVISGGAFGITKSGGGALVLTGVNTFTGPISITGGALRAAEGTNISADSAMSLNGGVYETSGTLTREVGPAAGQFRILGNTSGIGAQGGPLIVNLGGAGASLDWGTPNFNPGSLVLQHYSANALLTVENGINLGANYRNIDVRGDTVVVSGPVTGSAGFTINGSNQSTSSNAVLRFTNTNTYGGRTVIANNAGGRNRLAFSRDENLGAVPTESYTDNIVLVGGGVLQADETVVLNANRHIGIGSSGGGNSVTGGISVQQTKHLTIPGSVANRTLAGFSDVITTPSTGSLLKIDPGTLYLVNPTNTYTGGTTINGGNFTITKLADGGLPSTIGVSANVPANLNLNGGRLQYYGDGDSTDRLFTVSAGNTTLEASGAGPLHFTNPGSNVTTSTGGRNLNLTGYASGNTMAPGFADGATVNVTATFTTTANQVTVPSTTGLAIGQYISGTGIPDGTVINAISGTTLTLSTSTTGASGTSTPADITTRLTLVKTGSGSWTFTGTNVHTGLTRIRGGGPLTLDYSGAGNTADPMGTGTVILEAGSLIFKGKSSGTTAETLSLYLLGESQFARTTTILDKGAGSGVALTINTLQGSSGSTQRHDLIDLSSGSGNSVTVNALGSSLSMVNGVLMNNTSASRASIVVKGTDGSYGFASLPTVPGLLGINSPTEVLPGVNLASSSNTANQIFNAGEYATTTSDYKFSTLTFDSRQGPISFNIGGKLNPDASGKAILFSGTSTVQLSGANSAVASPSPLWFHNHLADTAALDLDFNIGPSQVIMFGGSGFTDYSGTGFGVTFMVNGGLFRVTGVQDIATTTGKSFRVTNGAVFEIGADLNGSNPGDVTNPVGENTSGADTASKFRFLGDSGISAWTPEGGGFRVVNFGDGQALAWGAGSFLTNSQDSGYDGDYTLKLSSPRANATIELKNNISLNNRHRVIEVATGTNDPQTTDAVLSGALSGAGVGFTKTGPGILALTGTNTYTGETRIAQGILRLGTDTLSPDSRMRIDTGGAVEVTGTVHVTSLVINGAVQPEGPVNAPGFVTGNLVVGSSSELGPYEQWALAKNLPEGKNGPGDDADEDGVKNVVEYAVEANPLKSGDVIVRVSNTSPVTLNYQHWQGKTDITVHLESSPDLVTWTPIVTSTQGALPTSVVSDVFVSGTVPPTDPLNLAVLDSRTSTGKFFYRLRVVK